MVKKLVKRDENVVFFFGKRRKFNEGDEFKLGRMLVRVAPESIGADPTWYAELYGHEGAVRINVGHARSRAAALKQLERRLEGLQRALDTICRESW